MKISKPSVEVLDLEPNAENFYNEVFAGLNKEQKQLDSKLLYDEKGSNLFEKITTLPEYYLTRTELLILRRYAKEIVSYFGEHALLIDLGSGSSEKVKILLDKVPNLAAYIAVDISKVFLEKSAIALANEYPNLKVAAMCADYTQSIDLPDIYQERKRIVFFPGSTFGNFEPSHAEAFLKRISKMLTKGDGLLIGIDMKKDTSILHRAYNDSLGVTAAFNLNVLDRINRELHASFQLHQFKHDAFYNDEQERIEMHIKSLVDQVVMIDKKPIVFKKGETIHTENSYKYDINSFQTMTEKNGFKTKQVWTDPDSLFSVHYLTVCSP
ncbi:L-histidine N(alpha)-methyltransferase [Ectobacillus polymachus]|uniref:L-histidine N(alpha)-methyltransferase n=1 Tax=Ectobacillus polymachus TaxID=1508806 RepID=UPI003A887822